MSALTELAEAAGVATHWKNYREEPQEVSEDALYAILSVLGYPCGSDAQIAESRARIAAERSGLPPLITAVVGEPVEVPGGPYELTLEGGTRRSGTDLPPIDEPGYHQLELAGQRTTLAVAPRQAFRPDPQGRPWALAVQLYALRREGDAGLGDFRALEELIAPAARHGAAGIAISPVHAQFSADPDRFSPYAPSSRINLNVLHAAHDWPRTEQTGQLERDALVDWPVASRIRLAALREAFGAADREALQRFRAERGDALETHARFEAIHAEQFGRHRRWHWRDWPDGLRHPSQKEVARFAETHADEVAFHAWLQMLADRSLASAQMAARAAGMPIGLIADLAVGADSGGSHGWARQEETLLGLSIGAPPDLLAKSGQNWGLAAFSPAGLRANGFGAFLEMLRTAMRHAGGVRIDHALGLRRLWIVPDGRPSTEGAYLAMPQQDLLRLIALESHRHRAIVLGEDLGTIPDGFQDELQAAGLLGMRVLWFERDDTNFKPPRTWSRRAAAMTSTHDLPTLAGWWHGRDLAWRAKLDLAGGKEREAEEGHERFRDRFLLWDAMRESGAASGEPPPDADVATFADAAVAHVVSAASDLAIIPIEDVLALEEQPNLPGTMDDQHPNWRRRLPATAENLFADPRVAARLAALAKARTS